jgi:glucose/mannose-6-phosphate isomerase
MVFLGFGEDPMRGFAERFAKLTEEGIKIGNDFNPPKVDGITNVIVCGLGGSGVCGDLLVDVGKLSVPVIVVKDYHLPKFANEKSLVFCISYSGNTEETLSQFMQAKNLGCKTIAITSGGKLREWSEKLNIPCLVIPGGYNPRDALQLMMYPLLITLQKIGFGDFEKNFQESLDVIGKINTHDLDDLAGRIKNSRLAIYGTSDHMGSLRRIKNEFNENAKMAVMYDYFPEINHNEMNGYQRTGLTKNVDVIFLRDRHETEEMKVRIEVTKEMLGHYVNTINELWAVGESKLARTMSFVFMGAYVTAKIASLTGINREKVPFVDRLKEALNLKLNTVQKLEKEVEVKQKEKEISPTS